jgi:hypothetical protein
MPYRVCTQAHRAGENPYGEIHPHLVVREPSRKEPAKARPSLLFENLLDEDVLHAALSEVPPFPRGWWMI